MLIHFLNSKCYYTSENIIFFIRVIVIVSIIIILGNVLILKKGTIKTFKVLYVIGNLSKENIGKLAGNVGVILSDNQTNTEN